MDLRGLRALPRAEVHSCLRARPWGEHSLGVPLAAGWTVLEIPCSRGPHAGRFDLRYSTPEGHVYHTLNEVRVAMSLQHSVRTMQRPDCASQDGRQLTISGKVPALTCGRRGHKPTCQCHLKNLKMQRTGDNANTSRRNSSTGAQPGPNAAPQGPQNIEDADAAMARKLQKMLTASSGQRRGRSSEESWQQRMDEQMARRLQAEMNKNSGGPPRKKRRMWDKMDYATSEGEQSSEDSDTEVDDKHQDDIATGRERGGYPITWHNTVDSATLGPLYALRYVTEYCTGANVRMQRNTSHALRVCEAAGQCYVPTFLPEGEHPSFRLDPRILKSRTPVVECNFASPCDRNCPGRLVQHGLPQLPKGEYTSISCSPALFEIYRTNERAWSVRAAAKDIPQGAFVMEIVGELISSQTAAQRKVQSQISATSAAACRTQCDGLGLGSSLG